MIPLPRMRQIQMTLARGNDDKYNSSGNGLSTSTSSSGENSGSLASRLMEKKTKTSISGNGVGGREIRRVELSTNERRKARREFFDDFVAANGFPDASAGGADADG